MMSPGRGGVDQGWKNVPQEIALSLSSAEQFLRLPPDQMALLVRSGALAPGSRLDRLRSLLMLGRPRTCVPGLLCYALGHSYTGAGFSGRMALGGFLSFLIGFSANLHNAYTDIEEDSRNLPGRVYLLARLGRWQLLRILVGLCLFMMAAAATLELHFLIFMILGLLGLHQYSFSPCRAKERPILGLWVFAQAVVFPFLFGWGTEPDAMLRAFLSPLIAPLFGGELPPHWLVFQSHRYLGMVIFLTLWFMAKGAFKNVPDFYGDLAAGLRTSATICGSWRNAARATAAVTIGAYLSLAVLVGLGLESPRLLLALLWLGPVIWNCRRLLRAQDGARGNECLKTDMWLSSGFIASVLLLVAPRWESLATVAIGALILFGSDLLGLDSRRQEDVSRKRVS